MKRLRFFVIPRWGLALGAPPKCGSTSIKRALDHSKVDYEIKYAHQLPDRLPVVFIVRHPLDRFKSLWRFRCVPGGDMVHGTGRDLHGMTPAQFWRYIRKAPADNHWVSQTKLLEGREATLVRLDDLEKWWDLGTPSKVPLLRYNETTGDCPTDAKLEAAILEHYADDVKLFEEAI